MKKKFELTLTKSYASQWGLQEALRELIQNAIDQEKQISGNTMSINYSKEHSKLSICNKNSILSRKSLLLGFTSKDNDESTIGQFGEGYKIALLVLNRLNKNVTIYNYGAKEVWTSKFVKSKRYEGEEILTITVNTEAIWNKVPNNNLTIEIEDISEDDYSELISRTLFLQEEINTLDVKDYGSILLDEKFKHKIYVNGLYISKNIDLDYGYNILPKHLELGRDRDLVNNFNLISITSDMWAFSNSPIVIDLINKGSKDVGYMDIRARHHDVNNYDYITETFKSTENAESISDKVYLDFVNKYGDNAIAVSNQSEKELNEKLYEGSKIVVVNDTAKVLIVRNEKYIESIDKLESSGKVTPKDEYLQWRKEYKGTLTSIQLSKLDRIFEKAIGEKLN